MSPTQPLPPKKEVALALLERSSVYVHLDPRQQAAVVPPWFKKQPQLVLQVGLNMPVPIPDLRLDDEGIQCTLSFNRAPFFCVVPWSSIFAMVGEDGRGMVWPDDVPVEVARQAQERADGPVRREPSKPTPPPREPKVEAVAKPKRSRKRPPLAAVPGGGEDATGSRAHAKPERIAPPAARPAVAQPDVARPSASGAAGSARKKRELPPYLRIVK
jgi:hypothetical protein